VNESVLFSALSVDISGCLLPKELKLKCIQLLTMYIIYILYIYSIHIIFHVDPLLSSLLYVRLKTNKDKCVNMQQFDNRFVFQAPSGQRRYQCSFKVEGLSTHLVPAALGPGLRGG